MLDYVVDVLLQPVGGSERIQQVVGPWAQVGTLRNRLLRQRKALRREVKIECGCLLKINARLHLLRSLTGNAIRPLNTLLRFNGVLRCISDDERRRGFIQETVVNLVDDQTMAADMQNRLEFEEFMSERRL